MKKIIFTAYAYDIDGEFKGEVCAVTARDTKDALALLEMEGYNTEGIVLIPELENGQPKWVRQ